MRNKLSPEHTAIIIEALKAGMTTSQIAIEVGLPRQAITAIAARVGLTLTRKKKLEIRDNLIRDFKQGIDEKWLSQKYKRPIDSVTQCLRANVPGYRSPSSRRLEERDAKICQLFKRGKRPKEIAAVIGIHAQRVKQVLKREGIFKPTTAGRPRGM